MLVLVEPSDMMTAFEPSSSRFATDAIFLTLDEHAGPMAATGWIGSAFQTSNASSPRPVSG